MNTFTLVLELIGTAAFAVSGAMVALKKDMDIFGVAILGLTTATGGGVIRDLLLGVTPPVMFRDPIYALVAIGTSILIFIPSVRRLILHKPAMYDRFMLIVDSLGLAVFTVAGIQSAYSLSDSYNAFLLLFVGVITGVGGGVMRDVMAGNTPYIFVKHIYACASALGALACILLRDILGAYISMAIGAALVFVIRLLAAHFRWSLPHAKEL